MWLLIDRDNRTCWWLQWRLCWVPNRPMIASVSGCAESYGIDLPKWMCVEVSWFCREPVRCAQDVVKEAEPDGNLPYARNANDATRYSFTMRITNVWNSNSLPFSVVTAPSVNSFKNRLDKQWASQELRYDWDADYYQEPGVEAELNFEFFEVMF